MSGNHQRYMQVALSLARRHLGHTWPNPAVGAVIVKDNQIIGQGYTAYGGRPHAETQALEQAGLQGRGACLYVTLEPCTHHGKTPPCTDAIIHAGITTVVVACGDPNPQVQGKGMVQLRNAGINIVEGICTQEATDINRGFFSVIEKKRPLISLKLATSLDGKIATRTGKSRWITGEPSRHYGHVLRSRYDAIATGIGTVIADDPLLTCRLPGLEEASPIRIIFDRHLRLSPDSKLAQTAKNTPVWVITGQEKPQSEDLTALGVHVLPASDRNGLIDLRDALQILAQKGITRLLIEAGGKLSTAFLQSGLVDRMYWFHAPVMIGNDGLAAVDTGFTPVLAQLPRWKTIAQISLQPDMLSILECSPA